MMTTGIKRFATCLIALIAAAIMMLALSACAPKEITVTVVDGDNTTEVATEEGKTVEEILAANDITLNEGDVVDPALETEIEDDGATITIQRMQSIVIAVDGENVDVQLLAGATVQDALDKAEVTLADGDTVDVEVTELLEDGMLITVTRAPKEQTNTQASTSKSSTKQNTQATQSQSTAPAKTVVSKTKVENCSGDGHGYYEITWSDGSVTTEEY